MSTEKITGAASGAARGAAAGTAIAPGIGTVIGGVIGAIGGLLGSRGSSRRKRYGRELANVQRFIERRQEVIRGRVGVAQVITGAAVGGAGLERSSNPQGVTGSILTQTGTNLRLGAFMDKRSSGIAKINENQATWQGILRAGASVATAYGDFRTKTRDLGKTTDTTTG